MRICSLLPSATEIVFALGKGAELVGVTHECDYPAEALTIAKLTRTNIPSNLSSREIDEKVGSTLNSTGSLYEIDFELLERLRPDLILTQRLCDVCAVSYDRVQEAVKSLPSRPKVLNLEPHSIADILENIRCVAAEIGCDGAAEGFIGSLRRRIDWVREKAKGSARRSRVFCMEWVNPPYCGGHWMKELVEMAGGRDDLANLHRPSTRIDWRKVIEFAPEVIILTCCGFDLKRCEKEGDILAGFERFNELPAVRAGRVYATDGSSYFSRPGPRIVESLEIIAHLIHPELFPAPNLPKAFAAVDLPRGVPA